MASYGNDSLFLYRVSFVAAGGICSSHSETTTSRLLVTTDRRSCGSCRTRTASSYKEQLSTAHGLYWTRQKCGLISESRSVFILLGYFLLEPKDVHGRADNSW